MHSEILNDRQTELLPLMAQFRREYYLVGGTAIADITACATRLFDELFSEKMFRSQLCYFDDIEYNEVVDWLMLPLTYIHASEAARTTAGGRGIVGNAIPADAPTRSLSKRCNAGAVMRLVGNASKRCNAGAVTLGSVTYYEAARTTADGRGIVGNAIPADAPTRSLSKRCKPGLSRLEA